MADTDALELPVGLSEKQFMQQVARLESRLAQMEGNAAKRFKGANEPLAQSFKGVENAARGMSNATKASLQNTGYQIQDIIVQIQGGQGVVRAFSQQLPQMLGGMGLVGVGLGILAPLILGVGAALIGVTDDAKAAEEQMKRLADAVNAVSETSKAAGQSRADLIGAFGPDMADQARQMLQIQAELAKVNLSRELSGAADMIGAGQFDLDGTTADQWVRLGEAAEAYFAKLEAAKQAGDTYGLSGIQNEFGALVLEIGLGVAELDRLKETFGVTYAEAGKLGSAMVDLRNASTDQAIAASAGNLRDALRDALGNMEGITPEAAALLEQLLNVEDAALRAAAADMTATITPAANEAKRLADELGRAVQNAMNLAMQGISDVRRAQIEWDFRSDPKGRAAAMAREQFDAATPVPADADPTIKNVLEQRRREFVESAVATEEYRQKLSAWRKEEAAAARDAKKSGGGGRKDRANAYESAILTMQGNLSATEEQIEAYRNLGGSLQDVDRQMAIITERQRLLTAAQKAGQEVTPAMLSEIDQLVAAYIDAEDQLKGMQDAASKGEDALQSLFGSIFDGAKSGKQALADLIMQIAKVQMFKGMMMIPGLGGIGSAIGGLLSFDGGGTTGSGPRAGGLDGKGGFMALLHPNETVIDHTKSQGGSGGIGMSASQLTLTDDGRIMAHVRAEVQAGVGRNNRSVSDQKYLRGGR